MLPPLWRTAVDVVAYAAHLACQLGAHVVKVKPPTEHIESQAARAALEKAGVPLGTLADRVRHVVQSAFDGHRIVIFSGGAAKETAAVLEENRQTSSTQTRRCRCTGRPDERPRHHEAVFTWNA